MDRVRDITFQGYASVIKEVMVPHLEKALKMQILVEPNPIAPIEPHFRLLFTGFEFEPVQLVEDTYRVTGYDLYSLYVLKLNILGTLTAYGDGPDAFLDECVQASWKCSRLFQKPFSIEVIPKRFYLTVLGKKRPGGQFFKNEEQGKKPYLYEENWDISILMPYTEIKPELRR